MVTMVIHLHWVKLRCQCVPSYLPQDLTDTSWGHYGLYTILPCSLCACQVSLLPAWHLNFDPSNGDDSMATCDICGLFCGLESGGVWSHPERRSLMSPQCLHFLFHIWEHKIQSQSETFRCRSSFCSLVEDVGSDMDISICKFYFLLSFCQCCESLNRSMTTDVFIP